MPVYPGAQGSAPLLRRVSLFTASGVPGFSGTPDGARKLPAQMQIIPKAQCRNKPRPLTSTGPDKTPGPWHAFRQQQPNTKLLSLELSIYSTPLMKHFESRNHY
jgi:hypothetical protein